MKRKFRQRITALTVTLCCLVLLVSCTVQEEAPLQFSGKTIGIQAGSEASFACEAYRQSGAAVEEYGDISDAAAALLGKRIDFVVTDEWTAATLLEANKELSLFGKTEYHADYVACFYEQEALCEAFTNVLRELLSEGTVERICDAYRGGEPYRVPAPPANAKCLVMLTDAVNAPYSFTDENGEIAGIEPDIARTVAARLGFRLEIRDRAFDRLFTELSQGKGDFAMSEILANEEREAVYDFSLPYLSVRQSILVNA